jgi:hypothetical protein
MKTVAQAALGQRIDTSFDDIAIRLGPTLRNTARDAGWPEELVSSLRVINKEGELSPEVPPHLESIAESMEYGDLGEAPKPALHQFTTSETVDEERREATDEAVQWALDAIGSMFA